MKEKIKEFLTANEYTSLLSIRRFQQKKGFGNIIIINPTSIGSSVPVTLLSSVTAHTKSDIFVWISNSSFLC